MRKPYYRKDRKAWYVKSSDGRTQTFLDVDEAKAYDAWHEMQRLGNLSHPHVTFATVADRYLIWAELNIARKTYHGYAADLLKAVADFGAVKVRDLKRHHVTDWLDRETTWGTWARRRGGAAVTRALNWAVEQGHLTSSPIGKLGLPKGERRDVLISEGVHEQMMQSQDGGRQPGERIKNLGRRAISRDGCIRPVLIALRHSGTRPGMVAAVTAEDVSPHLDAWILKQHKTRKSTGKPLIIQLSPCLQTLTRILLANRTSGPLFLNSKGTKWTSDAIQRRIANMEKKLGLPEGTVAYAYRHTWTTNAILNGVNVATVATMLGHKDLRMLMDHYAHLEKVPDHLRDAAAKAMQRRA